MSDWILDGETIIKMATGERLDTRDLREPPHRPRPLSLDEARTPQGQAELAARRAALAEWAARDPRKQPLYQEYLAFLNSGGTPARATD